MALTKSELAKKTGVKPEKKSAAEAVLTVGTETVKTTTEKPVEAPQKTVEEPKKTETKKTTPKSKKKPVKAPEKPVEQIKDYGVKSNGEARQKPGRKPSGVEVTKISLAYPSELTELMAIAAGANSGGNLTQYIVGLIKADLEENEKTYRAIQKLQNK